jgi:hypothetical protein
MIKKIICLLKIYVRFIDINLIQNNKMEENLLNTEQTNDAQDQIDLANASLIFAKALGLILKDNEGIVVDISENVDLGEDVKKVIIFKSVNQVHIYKCDEDYEEGTSVNLVPSKPETETDNTGENI